MAGGDDDAMRVYFEAVSDYETQDIEAAVGNFLGGTAPGHNPSFAPPAPLVGAETRRVMNLRLDRMNRQKTLRPRLPTTDIQRSPESMARVAALMAQAIEGLAAEKRTEDAAADKRRAELFAKTNARFAPDMSHEAVRARLNPSRPYYAVGNDDGEVA